MNRFARVTVVVSALSLGAMLSGCESFDPTDIFSSDMFSTKRKLPGDRKAVFPDGTPGVDQGVPRELVKGYQPPSEPEPPQPPQAQAEEPKAKPKPKPRPQVVAKPVPAEPSESASAAARPAQTQRPEPPQAQQQPQRSQPAAGGWPGSSQQPQGQVAWPDPPATGTFSR
jgi:hypothetical protein